MHQLRDQHIEICTHTNKQAPTKMQAHNKHKNTMSHKLALMHAPTHLHTPTYAFPQVCINMHAYTCRHQHTPTNTHAWVCINKPIVKHSQTHKRANYAHTNRNAPRASNDINALTCMYQNSNTNTHAHTHTHQHACIKTQSQTCTQ